MNIEQGTPEWLSLRKGRITASKIPVIMGLSPYQTPRQLWEEELGFRPPKETKPHMLEGLEREAEMASFFEQQNGVKVKPDVVFHKTNSKFMASLDGINEDRTIITEYKNNNKEYHERARKGSPVEFHVLQMQWQMFCEGQNVRSVHYVSRNGEEKIVVVVYRDDSTISQLETAAIEFLRMIDDLEEPPLIDADYADLSLDEELNDLLRRYKQVKDEERKLSSLSEKLKKNIISRAGDRNCRGTAWKLSKIIRKGNIDYTTALEEMKMDLSQFERFRKASITTYKIIID